MWILPSRSRPHILRRFFDAALAAGMATPGIVRLDRDDPFLSEYLGMELPHDWHFVAGSRIGLGATTNEVFSDNPHEPWYGLLGDDAVPVTPEWDRRFIDAAGSEGIAWGPDGINDEKNVGHCVIGGDTARRWGWLILPGLTRIYGDNVITERGRREGLLRYCSDVRVEHWHFSTGKTPKDKTYEKPEASADHEIYMKWRNKFSPAPSVTVCCVNAGNYLGRGAQYVNNLYSMVSRNLAEGFRGRFVCFTDDATGLSAGIETKPLPVPGLDGWWNKLSLFKEGVFEEGERVWFFDLDTLITGPLDDIFQYDGPFATLTDFYHPQLIGPAIMSWRVCEDISLIFKQWQGDGFPQNGHGDLWWLNNLDEGRFARRADKLQKLYPGKFVSFKVHCRPYPPEGTSVVCFHGLPRPHECSQRWVTEIWAERDVAGLNIVVERNTHLDIVRKQIAASADRNVDRLKSLPAHDEKVCIVGGGPSLAETLWEIKAAKGRGEKIWALNGTFDWLIAKGVSPDAMVILDARQENARFVANPIPLAKYYLASQCHGSVYDALKGHDVTRFDIDTLGDCGTTVGMYAMCIAYVVGFRTIRLYGFDSSYRDGEGHAYVQLLNEGEQVLEVYAGDEKFHAAPWMAQQAKDFVSLAPDLINSGCEISVHGDGLIPHLARLMANPQSQAA